MQNQYGNSHKPHCFLVVRNRLARSVTRLAYLVEADAPDIVIRTERRLIDSLVSELEQTAIRKEADTTKTVLSLLRLQPGPISMAQIAEVA